MSLNYRVKTIYMTIFIENNLLKIAIPNNLSEFLALMCQGQLKPDSPVIQASVKRVSTTITSSKQIKARYQLEQAQMYEKRRDLV